MSKTGTINCARRAAASMHGIIASLHPDGCDVLFGGEIRRCLLPPRQKGLKPDPAPGDRVSFYACAGGTCVIQEMLPRTSVFARVDPRPPHEERVIAANIDLAVIVVAAKEPPPRPGLVDRCLAAALLGGAQPLICLNKSDLATAAEAPLLAEIERTCADLEVPIVRCSALTGAGLGDLLPPLRGKTAAFVGQSGAGKSSLLNALVPGLGLRTNPVRAADGRGRHTTTATRLAALDGGTIIFDTPGFKEFGLGLPGPAKLSRCFPDFAPYAAACRYADCVHADEPGCGVRNAVRDGLIAPSRYGSYLKILGRPSSGERSIPSSFTCVNCGEPVGPGGAGTRHRNHCPRCLHSLHLDARPGDRAACCGGIMEPIAVWVRSGQEWALIHRCRECGALSSNRIAADDNEMLLMQLAVKPLAMPAFPLARLAGGR